MKDRFSICRGHRHDLVRDHSIAVHHAAGVEFLYRDLNIQHGVSADIGNAEAALPENASDNEAVIKNASRCKQVRICLGQFKGSAAFTANLIFIIIASHTAIAILHKITPYTCTRC